MLNLCFKKAVILINDKDYFNFNEIINMLQANAEAQCNLTFDLSIDKHDSRWKVHREYNNNTVDKLRYFMHDLKAVFKLEYKRNI